MNKHIKGKFTHMVEAMKEMAEALQIYLKKETQNRFYFYAAEKKAEEIVDCAISINKYILYDDLGKSSKSYYDSFIDLKKIEIFSDQFLEKIAQTAGFRNRLAHEYLDLNEKITIDSMKNILKLYPQYLKNIKKYLSEK